MILGLLALVLWLLALASYNPQDAAWSTSGASQMAAQANWAGRLGAWIADSSYFVFGFSVWWGVAAAVRAWLSALAHWMDGGTAQEAPAGASPWWAHRALFWGGLALLLAALYAGSLLARSSD